MLNEKLKNKRVKSATGWSIIKLLSPLLIKVISVSLKLLKKTTIQELQEWKKKCDQLEKRLVDETKELKVIMEQVFFRIMHKRLIEFYSINTLINNVLKHKKTEQKLRHVLSQAESSSGKNNANNEVVRY